MERAVVQRRLEVDEREAGQHALGRRLPDALLDAGKEALGDRAADDLVRELDARRGVGRELDPDVAEHAVAAGLLLVAAVRLGRAADRLAVGDRGRPGHDRGAELALEALGDDRDLRLADGPQDLLAGLGPLDARGRLLLEHPGQRGAHLVEVALGHGLDGDLERGVREVDRREAEGGVAGRERVAGLGDAELRDRADLARPELARRLLLLAVEVEQLADALVLALRGVEDVPWLLIVPERTRR